MKTGDTLCVETHPIILEAMKFPEPVIAVAIEPKTKADEEKLSEAMKKLATEKPAAPGTTSLGALLKAKLDTQNR